MSFEPKNTLSEFQHVMNDTHNDYSELSIVYIDDFLIYLKNLDQYFKHLKILFDVIKRNDLVVLAPKMKLFQTKIQFLGHDN